MALPGTSVGITLAWWNKYLSLWTTNTVRDRKRFPTDAMPSCRAKWLQIYSIVGLRYVHLSLRARSKHKWRDSTEYIGLTEHVLRSRSLFEKQASYKQCVFQSTRLCCDTENRQLQGNTLLYSCWSGRKTPKGNTGHPCSLLRRDNVAGLLWNMRDVPTNSYIYAADIK